MGVGNWGLDGVGESLDLLTTEDEQDNGPLKVDLPFVLFNYPSLRYNLASSQPNQTVYGSFCSSRLGELTCDFFKPKSRHLTELWAFKVAI